LGTISKNFPSRFLAYISYQLIGIRRKTVESNLSRAFPEKSRSEIKRLAFKIYEAIAVTFLEILRLNKMNPDKIKKIFSDEGFEKIHRKLEQDKGLIFLTGHFGNWEIGAIATNIYLGQGLSVLVKKQKNPYVANWLTAFRERLGNTEITLGTSVKELYKAVKSRKIVGIVGDQRGTREGVKVKFFGETTYTFPGTAAIALRTGCPVVVMLCPRQSDGSYKAIIEEIDHSEFTGSENEKIQQFNQKYMSILEGVIRQYPEQWFWMHNIWKYSNRIS
jgi:KDO2-lipid IV(A) lauroyltransferase